MKSLSAFFSILLDNFPIICLTISLKFNFGDPLDLFPLFLLTPVLSDGSIPVHLTNNTATENACGRGRKTLRESVLTRGAGGRGEASRAPYREREERD